MDESRDQSLDQALSASDAARRPAMRATRHARAQWLDAMADALDDGRVKLVAIAAQETSIATARLEGEVDRTINQLRLFAGVCREGSYLEVSCDEAAETNSITRRLLMPLGPVGVFAASNFPFAFSVLGGDTASAIAAGCPVIVKAHPGHPKLSAATFEAAVRALEQANAPRGLLHLVFGESTGRDIVRAAQVKAVGFTGSLAGGRALFDLASNRDDPIPFYGELGSINPVYVTPNTDMSRAESIAQEFVNAFTISQGQLCTKPGAIFVPSGSTIPILAQQQLSSVIATPLLNSRIVEGFDRGVGAWDSIPGVRRWSAGPAPADGGRQATLGVVSVPTLLTFRDTLLDEVFGPAALIVEYDSKAELHEAAAVVPPSLSAAIFGSEADPEVPGLVEILMERAGRLCWNCWPPGLAVSWSTHHGGPFPATTAPLHTSVGATSIRRWLRPIAFQDWPENLLPPDAQPTSDVPRRDGGRLILPA